MVGALLHALRVQLKRRVSARRGGDYKEVPQGIQKKSRPSPSNCANPFACKLPSEKGFRFRKANVVECRVFASHFPSDEVQNEAEIFSLGVDLYFLTRGILAFAFLCSYAARLGSINENGNFTSNQE